jgi:glutamate/tyrosine decarboxylase-like PLP-dependent enzyme
MCDFYSRILKNVSTPVAFTPSTRHYSWPKAATLIGIGQNAMRSITVDLDARMDIASLRSALQKCLDERTPVITVVAVIGSTEESAVDPLAGILSLRSDFRKQGLDFTIHADAAWGGYFNALLRADEVTPHFVTPLPYIPEIAMSQYVNEQYQALPEVDSITIDPHKAGYVPYPAGGLCYRNSAQRDMVSLKAPVIYHSKAEPTVGVYGIEGSKPGAAAAAVFLAHRVIPPTKGGFGKILGQCLWTSKRLYCRLATMTDPRFKITVFQRLPAERAGLPPAEVEQERQYIRDHFVQTSNDQLMKLLQSDSKAKELFMKLGSDQVILAYSFTALKNGEPCGDWVTFKALNDAVFDICSVTAEMTNAQVNLKELIVTSSSFDLESYGQAFIDDYARRLGLSPRGGSKIPFLISTTMNPWVTDTPDGDFLNVIQEALRSAVHQALTKLKIN